MLRQFIKHHLAAGHVAGARGGFMVRTQLNDFGRGLRARRGGEWAADSTIAILNGVRAVDIPLVTNRRWDTWINEPLLEAAEVNLNQSTLINAKKHK